MSKKTDVRALRRRLDMTQTEFWSRVGVTQSGGSRYESGRDIPSPVAILLTIAYGTPKERGKAIDKLIGAVAK